MKLKLALILLMVLVSVASAEVWEECPFGEVNEAYPGTCGSYVDSNGDDLCDYSQPNPGGDIILVKEEHTETGGDHLSCGSMRAMTIQEIADFYELEVNSYSGNLADLAGGEIKATDIFGDLETKYGIGTDGGKGIAILMKEGKLEAEVPVVTTQSEPASLMERYNFIPITGIVLLAIILSELLIKNKLRVRYIWNVVLLISFTLAAITSILYFLKLDIHATIVTLHIQLGLVAVWVGLYHAFKTLSYFKNALPRAKQVK